MTLTQLLRIENSSAYILKKICNVEFLHQELGHEVEEWKCVIFPSFVGRDLWVSWWGGNPTPGGASLRWTSSSCSHIHQVGETEAQRHHDLPRITWFVGSRAVSQPGLKREEHLLRWGPSRACPHSLPLLRTPTAHPVCLGGHLKTRLTPHPESPVPATCSSSRPDGPTFWASLPGAGADVAVQCVLAVA